MARHNLVSQMNSVAVSIPSYREEGLAKSNDKHFKVVLEMRL
ncbi:MAG: hypothetical protein ACJA1Z_003022 [Patiriisocius sp.]|jgi:hypothetical protein